MHKITDTQRTTGRQLDYMAENLTERHNATVSVQRVTVVFESGRRETKYWFSVESVGFAFKDTWKEAQEYYRELMKLKKEKV